MTTPVARRRTAALAIALGASLAHTGAAQTGDALGAPTVAGAITVTNKGISTVPTFTLGRPAVTFDIFIRHRRFGVDPQIRYALDGVPWAFLFWLRYRAVHTGRFDLLLGAHPAVNFRESSVAIAGETREVIIARRFLASEVQPTWTVARDVSVGAYWLYSRALESDLARHNNFVTLRARHANLLRSRRLAAQLLVQPYYLRQDDRDGTYVNSALTLGRTGWPLSLGASLTAPLRTNVPRGDETLWNVSATLALPR